MSRNPDIASTVSAPSADREPITIPLPSTDWQRGALQKHFEDGREKYGDLALSETHYRQDVLLLVHLRLSKIDLPKNEARVNECLSKLAGADLYLAIACNRSSEKAWRVLTSRFHPLMRAQIQERGLRSPESDNLARTILSDLAFLPSGTSRTRIGTFQGTSGLRKWLSVIVDRRLADRARERSFAEFDEEDDHSCSRPSGGSAPSNGSQNPVTNVLATEAGALLRKGFAAGWTNLNPGEQTALILKYRDDRRQNTIADLFGVGEPRISKVLKSAVDKIRTSITHHLTPSGDLQPIWSGLRDAIEESLATSESSNDHLPGRVNCQRKQKAGPNG